MSLYAKTDTCKLFMGDCLDVLRKMPDNHIDLTVTSPPYDNLRKYNGYSFDFEPIAQELYRVTKDGGVVVWIVGDATVKGSETGTSFKQALYFRDIGFNLHDTMIWNKGSFAFPATNRYHQVFEYMFVYSKGAPSTINLIKDRKNLYKGIRGASGRDSNGIRRSGVSSVTNDYGCRFNIWYQPIGKGHSATDTVAFKHPAIFPEQLAKDHITTWSNEGDVVLDPFMGSGTTMKACLELNRKCIGIEISEAYCEIIKDRCSLLRK